MSGRLCKGPVYILNAATSGTGTSINVKDFKHVVLQFGTASSANLTVKFQGSSSDSAPTFSSAQSVANHWDYVGVIDLEDGAAIAGDTGMSCGGTDDFRTFMVNVDGLNWVNATITARSAGTVTVVATAYTNL